MKHFNLIILLFISLISTAQTAESLYSVLNFSTSARQTALGGSALTLVDDINQPIWNPATINDNLVANASINYVNFLKAINYSSANYAFKIGKIGTFHTGVTQNSYGSFIGADENGNETGTFKAYDLAMSVGYAYHIPKSNFYIGTNLKLLNSIIEQFSSFGIATDIGLLYYNKEKSFRFAAVMRNFGLQLKTYDGTKEKLPMQISMGGSYQLEHVPIRFHGTIDNLQQWQLAYINPSDSTTNFEGDVIINEPSFLNNAMRHLVVGVELFPDHAFTLRTGMNFQRSNELAMKNVRTFAGINLGFGLRFKRFKLNYAFSKYLPIADTHSFGLEVNLN